MGSGEITAACAGTWTLGDLTVNRIGFGAMRLTAKPDTATELLRRAVALGVNHIDTAAFYRYPGGVLPFGSGRACSANGLIRGALSPYPDDLVITTKVGPAFDRWGRFYEATPGELRDQVEENLRQLGRDHLDVVNLRIARRSGTDSIAERFGALADLRDKGLIRQLGLSNVGPHQLAEAQAIAPVACVQNSYGVDYRRENDELVEACGRLGVAFVPFFAIAGAGREHGAGAERSEMVRAVARAHGATPHQVRLAWTLHQGRHVLAIPGTSNPDHLEANIGAGAIALTSEELSGLDGIAR